MFLTRLASALSDKKLSAPTFYTFEHCTPGGRAFTDVAELCDGCIVATDGWSSWGDGRQRGIVKWVENKLKQHK